MKARALIAGGKPVEDAAIEFVMRFEEAAGRQPRDTRKTKGAAADVESDDRVIEVKAFGRSARADGFLWLEKRQLEEAQALPDRFFIYVVENIAQGDPTLFTLREVGGADLAKLIRAAQPQTTYTLPLRAATYDGLPQLAGPIPAKKVKPPKGHNDKVPHRIKIVGQEEWLASPEGQRFQAMSESEREAYRSELFMAPAMEPFRRLLVDWVVKIRDREGREREAAAWLTTPCCSGKFVEIADRPKDPLDNPALLGELWGRADHLLFECASCHKPADLKGAADGWLAANGPAPGGDINAAGGSRQAR